MCRESSSEVLISSEVSHTGIITEDTQSCLLSFTFLSQGHKSYTHIMKDIYSREWFLASRPSSSGAYVLLTFSPLLMPTMPKTCLHLSRLHRRPERSQLKGKGLTLKCLQYLCHHPPEKHIINLMPRYVSHGLKACLRMLEVKRLFDITEPHEADSTKLCTLQTIHRQWRELNPKSHLYSFWKKIVVSC